MPEPDQRCTVCRQSHGGWGGAADQPAPDDWHPPQRFSDVAWAEARCDWARCRVCGQWWYQDVDPREQWTQWQPLEDSVGGWFDNGLSLAGLVERAPQSEDLARRWRTLFASELDRTAPDFDAVVEAIMARLAADDLSCHAVYLLFTTLRAIVDRAASVKPVPPRYRALYARQDKAARARFKRHGRREGWPLFELWHAQFPLERVRGAEVREDALIRVARIEPVTRWLGHRVVERAEAGWNHMRFVEVGAIHHMITHPRLRHVWWMPEAAWDRFASVLAPIARFTTAFATLREGAAGGDAQGWEACIANAGLIARMIPAERLQLDDSELVVIRALIDAVDPALSLPSRFGNGRGLPRLTADDVTQALRRIVAAAEHACAD